MNKDTLSRIGDAALAFIVLAAALTMAWKGLAGEREIPVSAAPSNDSGTIPDEAAVVVIDAGHGGPDGGAQGVSGSVEAELNLKVAELISDMLTKRGLYVIMTRSTADALGESKSADMAERGRIMRLPEADLTVSIHMNKFGDPTVEGPMVFYMKGNKASEEFADAVMESLCKSLSRPLRRTNPEDLFVLRTPDVPAILVDCGFLSNAEDEARLMTEEYRRSIAEGVCDGITAYLAAKENGAGTSPFPVDGH